MAAIDVGPGAVNRGATAIGNSTYIDIANPANDSGTITSIEIWAATNIGGVKIFTASRDGGKFTPRDVVTLADITAGSKVTRTVDSSSDPIALDVVSGDCLGIYYATGTIEREYSGGAGVYYSSGDQTGAGERTYTLLADDAISIYATGTTGGGATSIKTVMGVPIADIKTINGVAIADVKSFLGVSNVD